MLYRRLGRSNLKVSALCLGTMMFGDQTELDEAQRIVASAQEHGINFIDTADVYSKGRSEQMVGKLLHANRHDWVLATKLGNAMSAQPNQSHYSRSWMMYEVDNSLRRLATNPGRPDSRRQDPRLWRFQLQGLANCRNHSLM